MTARASDASRCLACREPHDDVRTAALHNLRLIVAMRACRWAGRLDRVPLVSRSLLNMADRAMSPWGGLPGGRS